MITIKMTSFTASHVHALITKARLAMEADPSYTNVKCSSTYQAYTDALRAVYKALGEKETT